MLSVLRYTDYDYPFGIFWPLCCLFYDIRIMITPLVSSNSSIDYACGLMRSLLDIIIGTQQDSRTIPSAREMRNKKPINDTDVLFMAV